MSANLTLDLGNTTQFGTSITGVPLLSGALVAGASGAIIGQSIDMLYSDTYCNVIMAGLASSGQLRVQVQSSDTDTSGTYTDPTSGLAQLPGVFASGGLIWVNSGGTGGGIFGPQTSGQSLASGFMAATAFQRPGRFVRANILNEGATQYGGALNVSFASQYKTTGSGAGFSWLPQASGQTVNV